MKMQKSRYKRFCYQPAAGVKTDIEMLLQQFSSMGTVRYAKFAEVWRDMKFSMFCAGRISNHEAKEFVEECFNIAVQFWLPPSSFLVRAGALYLLYGLYHFQLVSPKVKIRITQDQWSVVSQFHIEARKQQHLDLEFIFQKLLIEKAFVFVATPSEFFPSLKDREDSHYIPENLKEEGGVVEEIFSPSYIGQLELVHDQYQKMKVALNEEGASKPDSSLDIIHSDLILGIQKILSNHRWRQKSSRQALDLPDTADEDGDQNDPDVENQKGPSKKKSLKKKAYQTYTGYFKSRTKGLGSSEETADSTDTDVKDPEMKKLRPGRGRAQVMELYSKDDMIDLDDITEADVVAKYSMPDLDSIVLPQTQKTSDSVETGEETEADDEVHEGKGKAPKNGKRKAKGGKSSAKVEENIQTDSSPEKRQRRDSSSENASQDKKVKSNQKNSDNDGVTVKRKKRNKKQAKTSVKVRAGSQTKGKGRKNSTAGKTIGKTTKGSRPGCKIKESFTSEEQATTRPTRPSAQELLNKAIKERKKMQKIKQKKLKKKKIAHSHK